MTIFCICNKKLFNYLMFWKKNSSIVFIVLSIFIVFNILQRPYIKRKIRSQNSFPMPPVSESQSTVTTSIAKENNIKYTEDQIATIYSNLKRGGRQKRSLKKQHVAIIVPYRNREAHLSIFLRHIHSFLHQQDINYGIFIVEQITNQTFNRGKLMNVGFLEAIKDGPWNCFFFHDVDLIPLNSLNKYKCEYLPKHLSAAIDIFDFSVPYSANFGGVTAMFRHFFEKLNGFSNIFWGWGGEDDELRRRVFAVGAVFYRISAKIGRYKMIGHKRDPGNEAPPLKCRLKLINETNNRFHRDGLNTIKYTVLKKEYTQLYTHIVADLKEAISKKTSPYKC